MRFLSSLLRFTLAFLLMALALLVVVLVTPYGRTVLVSNINTYTRTLATPVVLGRLDGHVLRDVRLSSLTVADVGGVWLDVRGIRLVWHPFALWRGEAPFEMLEVQRVVMSRLPMATDAADASADTSQGHPLDYLMYVPRSVRFDDVLMETPVTGRRQRLRAAVVSNGDVRAISVSTLEGPVTTVSGSVVVRALDSGRIDLRVHEAPQGVLGGLLKLPAKADIQASLTAAMEGQAVTLHGLDMRLGQSRVVAKGHGNRDGTVLTGDMVLSVPDVSAWQGWLGDGTRGAVYGRLEVSGSLADLGVTLGVSRTDVTVQGVTVTDGRAALRGRVNVVDAGHPFTVTGDVVGNVSGVGQGVYPVTLGVNVSGTQAALGGDVSASMVRRGERADIVVSGAGEVSPAMAQGQLSGRWVQGAHTFKLAGGVVLTPALARLQDLQLSGPGTVVSGSGVVNFASRTVDGNAVVRVADVRPMASLAGVEARGGIDASVALDGKNGVQTGDVNVQRFDVVYGDYTARLKRASRLIWDGKQGSLSPFELEVAGGSVVAQGRMNADIVEGSLVVKNLDVTQLANSDVVTGRVNLQAHVSGRSDAPTVRIDGGMVGKTGVYPLGMTVKGDWRGRQLMLEGDLVSDAAKAHGNVAIDGTLRLFPFAMSVREASGMRGKVTADLPLAMFNTLLWESRQQIGGRLNGTATLAGSLGAPRVDGAFKLVEGAYNHNSSGVCLKNISADIIGNRESILVQDLLSNDGDGGHLTGKATVGLQGDRPLSARIDLDHLKLFCGGLATGEIDGSLDAKGTVTDHTLSGKVTIGPLNVQLPGSSNETNIPHVETIRAMAGAVEGAPKLTMTHLAIEVDAPQHVYVRGRGLDAEFGGHIAVRGTADNPLLVGNMKAIRGKFTLLDRILQLSDTNLRFEGLVPPSPYLDVKATTTVQGNEITLTVTGTAAKPQLALSSNPSLPKDEILALLLFGRKLQNISAFEALKLAQATRVLAGLDGGEPGILDKARQTLGVDTLDIKSNSDSGNVTVTTGKYVTDKIYVSVEQGAEPTDRKIKTEVELLPTVTGNTTMDGAGSQSFGVEWKRNY